MSEATEKYRAARDQLLSLRGQSDRARAEFNWPELTGKFNWAIDWFDAIGRGNENIALWIREIDGSERKYSFDEMCTRSDKVAAWLQERGVGKGDTVMLMLGNQVELWDSMLAIMKLGAVILPTAEAITSEDLVDRIKRARVKAVVSNPAEISKFDTVPGDYLRISTGAAQANWLSFQDAASAQPRAFEVVTEVDDPMMYYFTSGTTRLPKLVKHTQVSYPVGHLSTMYFIGCRPGDVHLNISSPGWGKHAWSSFFSPWIAEATIFVYNYRRFSARDLLDQMRRVDVGTFCAPPTVWRMLIQSDLGDRPASLHEVVGAGEPLNPAIIQQVEDAWGLRIRDGYGQTETTAMIANNPDEPIKIGSMGKPQPGVPVLIVDPETGEPSDDGEICLDLSGGRPLNLMLEYIDAPEMNAEVTRGGLYHTGDLATRDEEGFITFVGRTDDIFKSSDYKVSPFELENVLMQHPAVAEAAVVPKPDPTRLAVPKAYVKLAEGWKDSRDTALAILTHAKAHLAPYLRIRAVQFGELPKTVSGKTRRVVLRAQERERDLGESQDTTTEYNYRDFDELNPGRPAS